MTKHKEQRVLVLFDVQNLYYSAKQLYSTKVNFREILRQAVEGRKLVRAIAYVIKTEIKEEATFHDALENIGIEVKAKDIQIFYGGAKKGDWDIGIAMDAVRIAPKVDTVVLVSGDGDFKDLLSYLKGHGCRVEVMAFGPTTSRFLKDDADDFFDLSRNPKFLLGKRMPPRTHIPQATAHHGTHTHTTVATPLSKPTLKAKTAAQKKEEVDELDIPTLNILDE